MNKILLGAVALAMLAGPALADGRHRGHGGHHGGRSGGWVAPLVGGLILGGAGYYGYNQWRNTTYVDCRYESRFDRWGNYLGEVEVCYRVQY